MTHIDHFKVLGDKIVEKKLRQVTDNIHGTIFLSEVESELISTPYWRRIGMKKPPVQLGVNKNYFSK